MIGAQPLAALALIIDRPSTNTLAIAVIAVAIGWAMHVWSDWATRPPRPEPTTDVRPMPLEGAPIETPALVGLLTNEYEIPKSALTATVLDLASRQWIRITSVDDELLVVVRGNGVVGDTLRPYEQQVLNHLDACAFNGVTSASTLAASHHRLRRRWWLRFRRSIAMHGAELGIGRLRYPPSALALPAAGAFVGLAACWFAESGGSDVPLTDSWRSRLVWVATIVAGLVLAWRTAWRAAEVPLQPTDLGLERTDAWYGYRSRLRARIPPHASVIAPPAQQRALATGAVMGVVDQVHAQLPVAPEPYRIAWSEAGGRPHVVRIRYPYRPGYGQHPLKVLVAGVAVFFGARWLRRFFMRVADGDALQSLIDRVPGQVDLIETFAEVLAVLCWLPIVWAVWAAIAGLVDSITTRERTGMVVRVRRPSDVVPFSQIIKPFAERDRFSSYIAVDDGRHRTITAWMANDRAAAPQGAQARIRATPILGYVRSSEPVGTATRPGS